MKSQIIEDTAINKARVILTATYDEGYYLDLELVGIMGIFNISNEDGLSDTDLIKDWVANDFDLDKNVPKDGETYLFIIDVKESGEREDVFWHKYYEIEGFMKYLGQ